MSWHAVATRPREEAVVVRHLVRQGFEPWLPQFRMTRRHARRVEFAAAPLFPGYLFVALDAERQPWRSVNGTRGVRHLICQGDRPAIVPDAFIDELRSRRDAGGFVVLPQPELRPGDRVRFRGGPFAAQVATILRVGEGDRVWLLMELLGRPVTTAARREDIVAAA
jgi:transcriptional antiterminator RfaH